MNFYEIKNLKENIDIDTEGRSIFCKKNLLKNNLLMNTNKKKKLLLIADRGRSDVSVRLGFLAQKIVKRKNLNSHVLYEHSKKMKINRFLVYSV